MAAPVTLLKSFSDGQGILGGISKYVNYPQDHDLNYGQIETAFNQLNSEVQASRLVDSSIALDATTPSGELRGRMSPDEAKFTFSVGGTSVTVTGGRIIASGRKITVVGDTLVGFSTATTRYIAVDLAGLLYVETIAAQRFADIATIVQVGVTLAADELTDELGFDTGTTLATGDSTNRLYDRTDPQDAHWGEDDPTLRCVSKIGVNEDAGFDHAGSASRFNWISRKATAEGSGTAVVAAIHHELGQLSLLEQARCMATATAEAAGVSGAVAALNFDAAVRREPLSYFTDPWFDGSDDTFTQPGATAAERANFIGTYAFAGYVEFPDAGSTGPFLCDVIADGVTVFTARVAKVASGVTTIPVAGFFELADDAANTIQLRVAHSAAGALNCDARFGFHLIGGGA